LRKNHVGLHKFAVVNDFKSILAKYRSLTEERILNFDKFNYYAVVHHSNSIEGSTLTLEETELLLDKNLTPNSKPLHHTYMALDHYDALKFILDTAANKTALSEQIIKNTSALVMKNTGSMISAAAGNFDSSKGEYRKLTVRAGDTTFPDYKKVPGYVNKLVSDINQSLQKSESPEDIYKLSFNAHYQLVTIHPFADGNGRVSRLIMNYVQHYKGLPLTIIYNEDKLDYFNALKKTRENEDINIFYIYV